TATRAVASLVQHKLLEPLAKKEREQSSFSRARLPAQERRVRVLDDEPRHDARGDAFFTFAVDARHGLAPVARNEAWREATVTGCVYVGRSEVLIKSGERYRPAAFLLGKRLEPVDQELCRE